MLVATHIDLLTEEEVEERITGIISRLATNSGIHNRLKLVTVSNLTDRGIDAIRSVCSSSILHRKLWDYLTFFKAIEEHIRTTVTKGFLPQFKGPKQQKSEIPISWLYLESFLRELAVKKYFSAISWSSFMDLASLFNIWYPAAAKECALMLHKFGSIYYVDVSRFIIFSVLKLLGA